VTTDELPDLAGFRDAQERKRAVLGEDVTFLGQPVYVWPPGVPIDPETTRPYDPVIVPLSSGVASAVVRCGVFFRAINRAGVAGEVEIGALGVVDKSTVMLIAASAAASAIMGMERFQARDERFLIETTKFDGVSGIDRLLVYGSRG
jgi:hypothetical protein